MYNKILVPLDGSELSESVFPWLKLLHSSADPAPQFRIVRAFEPPGTVYLLPELQIPTSHILSDEHLGAALLEYLDRVKSLLPELNVETHLLMGDPAAEILEQSREADLVVMASHGRGGLGRWLLGSVASKVARGIEVPLLVVGSKVSTPPKNLHVRNILCPVDGSEPSERAYDEAVRLALQLKSKLFLYRSVSQVDIRDSFALSTNEAGLKLARLEMQALAEKAPPELDIEIEVSETYGRTGINRFAEKIKADLICIGSHGKSGLERWMLGSQTEKVLQTAHCPVLVTH